MQNAAGPLQDATGRLRGNAPVASPLEHTSCRTGGTFAVGAQEQSKNHADTSQRRIGTLSEFARPANHDAARR